MDSLELDVHAAIADLIQWWFHIDCFLVQIKKKRKNVVPVSFTQMHL